MLFADFLPYKRLERGLCGFGPVKAHVFSKADSVGPFALVWSAQHCHNLIQLIQLEKVSVIIILLFFFDHEIVCNIISVV